MLWKFRCRRFTFSIAVSLLFLYVARKLWTQYEHLVTQRTEATATATATATSIERVRISDVLAVNRFIGAAPIGESFYAYNRKLSDNIGAYRALPDTRDEICRARNYYLPQRRLKVSVIVAFHNEARSALMRTIMSLYRRTPSKYLHELILVDDDSDDALLLSTLRHLDVPPFSHNFHFTNATPVYHDTKNDDAVTTTTPATSSNSNDNEKIVVIKMQRNSRRLGLIESRNLGARLASGDYLLFLDSHCEVNVGWLEPLLERATLAQPNTNIVAVSPVLDSIDGTTLRYRASSQQLMGGFDWSLHFHWIRRQRGVNAADADTGKSFKSPVFSGGIFMISRKGFFKLNGFNSLLEIWGGESIEFSIKLWLCGGQIEIVPCSRVGHIFRKEHPFRFPNGGDGQATYLRNSKIIAESWLDSYKHTFYALKPLAKRIQLNISTAELQTFKEKHNCKPFSWYLVNVFPQLKLPNDDFTAFGTLSTAEQCLQILQSQELEAAPFNLNSNSKYNTHTNTPRIRLLMANCYQADVTHWYLHRHSRRLHSSNGACLNVARISTSTSRYQDDAGTAVTNSSHAQHFTVVLQYCRQTARTQRWLRRGAQLIHEQTHLCLDNPLNDVVAVSHCRHAAPTQLFRFTMEMQQL